MAFGWLKKVGSDPNYLQVLGWPSKWWSLSRLHPEGKIHQYLWKNIYIPRKLSWFSPKWTLWKRWTPETTLKNRRNPTSPRFITCQFLGARFSHVTRFLWWTPKNGGPKKLSPWSPPLRYWSTSSPPPKTAHSEATGPTWSHHDPNPWGRNGVAFLPRWMVGGFNQPYLEKYESQLETFPK